MQPIIHSPNVENWGNDQYIHTENTPQFQPQNYIGNNLGAMYIPRPQTDVPVAAEELATPYSYPMRAMSKPVPILYTDVVFTNRPPIALATPAVVVIARPSDMATRLVTG